jgi:hypothetical protein
MQEIDTPTHDFDTLVQEIDMGFDVNYCSDAAPIHLLFHQAIAGSLRNFKILFYFVMIECLPAFL